MPTQVLDAPILAAGLSLLALTLALLAVPARAHAARGMELALQDDAVFVDQRWMERDTALDHAVDLGTKRIRVNVLWARAARQRRRSPHAARRRPALRLLHASTRCRPPPRARGIKLQLTLTGPAPAWATKDHRVGNNQPDPAKYGAFVRTVVAHFAGRVDRYAIWNEPNWNTWLAPAQERARACTAPLQRRLHGDQGRRPEAPRCCSASSPRTAAAARSRR